MTSVISAITLHVIIDAVAEHDLHILDFKGVPIIIIIDLNIIFNHKKRFYINFWILREVHSPFFITKLRHLIDRYFTVIIVT
jgi:hypothetical protein